MISPEEPTPLERLLAGDRPEPLGAAAQARHKAQLRALVTAELTDSPVRGGTSTRGRRVRRWLTAFLGAGALVATGGVAVAFLPRAQPQHFDVVRCFSQAAGPFVEGPGNSSATLHDADTLQDSAHEALELCSQSWADGWLPDPETKDPASPPPGDQPVPELVACVLPDGVVGVFPGDDTTCIRLGLPNSQA